MTMRCDDDALSISGWKMTINMTIVGEVSGERSDPLTPPMVHTDRHRNIPRPSRCVTNG